MELDHRQLGRDHNHGVLRSRFVTPSLSGEHTFTLL